MSVTRATLDVALAMLTTSANATEVVVFASASMERQRVLAAYGFDPP